MSYLRPFRPRTVAHRLVLGDAPPAPRVVLVRPFDGMSDYADCSMISRECRRPGLHAASSGPRDDTPIARHVRPGSATIGVVATLDGVIAGYALCKPMRGYLMLADFAVDPLRRKRGIGTHLICYIKGRLLASVDVPREAIECVVHESTLEDLGVFLRRHGFLAVRWHDGRHVDDQGRVRLVYRADRAAGDSGCSNFDVE